jgi:hypothetical protein
MSNGMVAFIWEAGAWLQAGHVLAACITALGVPAHSTKPCDTELCTMIYIPGRLVKHAEGLWVFVWLLV